MSKSVVMILKEFDLNDDQILDIAVSENNSDGMILLKRYIHDKWNIDAPTALKVVKKLKEELN